MNDYFNQGGKQFNFEDNSLRAELLKIGYICYLVLPDPSSPNFQEKSREIHASFGYMLVYPSRLHNDRGNTWKDIIPNRNPLFLADENNGLVHILLEDKIPQGITVGDIACSEYHQINFTSEYDSKGFVHLMHPKLTQIITMSRKYFPNILSRTNSDRLTIEFDRDIATPFDKNTELPKQPTAIICDGKLQFV